MNNGPGSVKPTLSRADSASQMLGSVKLEASHCAFGAAEPQVVDVTSQVSWLAHD